MDSASKPGDLEEVIEFLRSYLAEQPVEFALLFGSHVTGGATDRSDIDIVLKFPPSFEDDERFDQKNRIAGQLMARLGREDVDVSDLETLPIPIAYAALTEGIRLIGDEKTIDGYRNDVATEYEQSADEREQSRQALLRRLRQGTYGR